MNVKAIAQHERGGFEAGESATTALTLSDPSASQAIPDDLHEWVEPPALLALAQGIAQTQDAETVRPVFSLASDHFYHPWRMLALLTYAYGRGLWCAEDIARAAYWDDALRELCRGVPPSSVLIRQFREQNRATLQRCLDRIIRTAWGKGHQGDDTGSHPWLVVEVLCDVHRRLHRAERGDAAFAERKGTTI